MTLRGRGALLYFRAALFSLLILRPSTHWLKVSDWPRCFHSNFNRESLGISPIVAARCRCSLGKNTTSTIALPVPAAAGMCAATALQNFAASRGWACRFCRWRCPLEEFRPSCAQLSSKKSTRLAQGLFHHPSSHWCVACACLLPGCFPRTGSLHPSVGVSIALRICSARRRWWACTVFTLWRSAGKKTTHRTVQSGC